MNQLYHFPSPIIFAHRGVSASAPENTLAAFQKAYDLGAEAIELDVQLNAGQRAIVIHDTTVDRTTDGRGRVRDLSLEELKSLDAGSFFSTEFAGERIPLLEEVFEAFGRKLFVNIELKNYDSLFNELPEIVANLVKRTRLQDWVMFSSFNPIALSRIRRLLPEIPVGFLTSTGWGGAFGRNLVGCWLSPQAIHPNKEDVTEKMLANQHKVGRRVNVWTVNELEEIKYLVELGVDGIVTDHPARAMEVRH